MLNDRLSASFILLEPSTPLPLQRRLLLPFGQVKGLYDKETLGYDSTITRALDHLMSIPLPTVQDACESATTLMTAGDAALTANNPAHALALYIQSFKAIHILIHNRTRRVLADTFFHASIPAGMYAGQTGMAVRVILRLRLVARCVAANLALACWGEAAYWGMRSIRIMREAMDTEFEDFLSEFLGGDDVGLIYARTGVAFMKMEKEKGVWEEELQAYKEEAVAGSERLFGLAVRYMKRGDMGAVRRELEAWGVGRETVKLFGDVERGEGSVAAQCGSGED